MVLSMRLLLSLTISLTLAASACFASENGLIINLPTMTIEYNKGQYQTAFYIGSQILKEEPSNLGVHYLLGNCYVKFGKLDKAKEEYTYCARAGLGSNIGSSAQQALQQLADQQSNAQPAAQAPVASGASSPAAATKNTADSATTPGAMPAAAVDKVDLQTLEYKERILKQGSDLIAANKAKLKKQIETIQRELEQGMQGISPDFDLGNGKIVPNNDYKGETARLQADAAKRIKQLEDDNAAEEIKIAAFYKGQAEAIGQQKSALTSQAQPGNGDVRLIQKGSGLFVRNYVNYHGQVPLPPPPPELQAKALPLDTSNQTKKAPGKIPRDGGNK